MAILAGVLGMGLRRVGLRRELKDAFQQAWSALRDVRVLLDADDLRWARRVEIAALAALALALATGPLTWSTWSWLRLS